MLHLGHLLFALVLVALLRVRAATTDEGCLNACSDYSQTLGYCYGKYGAQPWAQNYTYANAFMTCICNGTKDATAVQASDPRSQLLSDAGVCESCNSTPWLVQRDLAKLLTGCAIQEDNGSAAIAQDYAPTSYETARSSEYQLGNGGMRETMMASGLGVMLLVGAVALL